MVCLTPLKRRESGNALAQKFDGVAETDAVRFHDPVDYRAARLARAEAVPQILLGGDDQTGFVVVMEWTQPEQVRAVTFQLDALRFGQAL